MAEACKFPHLFSPIKIRNRVYRNRIITAPTLFSCSIFMEDIAENVYRMVENRAKGGAAEVSCGEVCVNFHEGVCAFARPFDYDKTEGPDFEAFCEYARRIKKHGAVAMMEVTHEAAQVSVDSPFIPFKGHDAWGPDDYVREDGVHVRAMDEAMMQSICNDFARAVRYFKAAGFDGIVLHGGHGFIIQQFLSPWTNHRTDAYGGSLENRARFPLRILRAMREACGDDMILEVRMSATDGPSGELEVSDVADFFKMTEGIVDIVHVSNGLKWEGNRSGTFSDMFDPHGLNVPFAAEIKKKVNIPVAVVGGINSPEFCEQVIADGLVDMVILGRQCYADPEFPNKAASGKEHLIRRCVRCYSCYPGTMEHPTDVDYAPEEMFLRMRPAAMGNCAINPKANFLLYPETMPVPEGSRKVLVVGGGVAGMQAAITAVERGHKVTLVEKSDVLGGIINFTDNDPDKVDLHNFKEVLKTELAEVGVDIRLGVEATPEYIREFAPEALIIAVGSETLTIPIPGIENAVPALKVYEKDTKLGKDVLFIGGGLVGCEVALYLAAEGHNVTVMEMLDRLAPESHRMYRTGMLDEMDKRGIKQLLSTRCLEICADGARAQSKDGEEFFVKADSVCYSLGMKAKKDLAASLAAAVDGIPVFHVGDCEHVGKVADAIDAGYMAAMKIL